MNVLYEEEGELKVGAVLASAPASFQIESPHGRRTKIKAASVVLSFERPAGAELLAQARRFADTLDTDFLWQCRKGAEFGFEDLARDYVGREPTPAEAAGVLIKLHSVPMYFYRRGKGRYQAAPEETLKRALAGLEKKQRVQQQVAEWTANLARFECPPEVAALKDELLYDPVRAKPEAKALEQACAQTGLSAARLLESCGLLEDSHAYHLGRFLHEFLPKGDVFAPHQLPTPPVDLPLADSPAFSLDDIGTTEIDDAFSVARISEDELRVGIHIAAPALAFAPGSALDAIARERLSTVYLPGRKFTMLPPEAIAPLSLDEAGERPALSLYLNVSAKDFTVRGRHSRIERVRVAANLRHATHEALNSAFESNTQTGLPFEDEFRSLWRVACALETKRGKPSAGGTQTDYTFRVEGDRVAIEPRKRGAPLDKAVAELMILANSTWGELLAERDFAGLYRVQSTGKVRLSVHAEPHEGLGVAAYAWFTSPLRRYVDLLNQWQLVAALRGARAPFTRSSESLLSALRAYEIVTARYEEHQRSLEHYWCLRWLAQERVSELDAVVLRENLARFERLPLAVRVPSMPELAPGTRVRLGIVNCDLLERSLECRWQASVGQNAA